jgi:UDP-N-acetylmuramate dehydrogenase
MDELMTKRKTSQPLEYPSCGSAFKRPEGYFAGALIEQCGLKGFGIGGARVSEKHAGFIINGGGATSDDVIKLLDYVAKTVFENTGVKMEPEIKVIE